MQKHFVAGKTNSKVQKKKEKEGYMKENNEWRIAQTINNVDNQVTSLIQMHTDINQTKQGDKAAK